MELRTVGKKDRPAVLLLPGKDWEPEALLAALKKLKKSYRLLIPVFEADESAGARLPALEDKLVRELGGTVWGAYGLGDGAQELLSLMGRERLHIRTGVVEGSFSPPEEALPEDAGTLRCWTGARDKAGKKSLEAFRARGGRAVALTLKKLPKGKSTLAYCPNIAAEQMKKAFGEAVYVSRTSLLPAEKDRVWRLLDKGPDEKESSRLDRAEPLRADAPRGELLYEGSSEELPLWSHRIRLEAEKKGLTRCTDQIFFRAGADSKVSKKAVKRYLLYLQVVRTLALLRSDAV